MPSVIERFLYDAAIFTYIIQFATFWPIFVRVIKVLNQTRDQIVVIMADVIALARGITRVIIVRLRIFARVLYRPRSSVVLYDEVL